MKTRFSCNFFISPHLVLNTSTSIGLSKAEIILFKADIRIPELGSLVGFWLQNIPN